MSQVPSLSYREIIRALQRAGWVVIRQRGSHIRLQKHTGERTLKITGPRAPSRQTIYASPATTDGAREAPAEL